MTFAEMFAGFEADAAARELSRDLPFEPIARLRASGFTALRVPVEFGGGGLDLVPFFDQIVSLATADSNLAHVLRGHFAFIEILRVLPQSPYRDDWYRAIVAGALVGNASSEQSGNSLADMSTTLTRDNERWSLTGRKFYSTGTLYCSHVYVAASLDGKRVTCVVPTDAPGVTVVDDWDGFGQRLTASGTTVFSDVEVEAASIRPYSGTPSHLPAFFQLFLVAVAAGISAAVLADAVAFVRPRSRTFVNANSDAPRDDPQVKQVIGQLSATAFTDRSVVRAAAAVMHGSDVSGHDTDSADAAEVAAYQAQVQVLGDALRSATLLFEVGGASATFRAADLDRHWRNARTIASHNPAIYKLSQIGDWELNGVEPTAAWRSLWTVGPVSHIA